MCNPNSIALIKGQILMMIAVIAVILICSCGGGGSAVETPPNGTNYTLTVGQIAGLGSVYEEQAVTLSINASCDNVISYSWSVNPTLAGVFTNSTSSTTSFIANEVAADTNVTVQVVVSATGEPAQTRNISLTIINVEAVQAPRIDTVWMTSFITGTNSIFSVTTNGSTPTSYSWEFGGGASPNTSSQQAPSVVLGNPGSYVGTVSVSNTHGSDSMNFGFTVDYAGHPFAILDGNAILLADDYTYLGLISSNRFLSDSIMNEFGTYGSKFSSTSIFNEFGTYGSEFSALSPWNDFATRPPLIFIGDVFVAYLTTNTFKTPRIDPFELIAYLSN